MVKRLPQGDRLPFRFTPKTRIDITVYNAANPSQIITSTSYYNVSANVPVSYTWYSSNSTPAGTYKIHYAYPDNGANTQWDDYWTIYVQNPTLYLDSPVDVDLPAGQYIVYRFTPSTSGVHRIYTGPYGGTGSSNDTVLEMYSDANLTNQIAYNDDSNGTLFSEIKPNLSAGVTYYVKLRHFSTSTGVHARLTATLDSQYPTIALNSPIDVDLPSGGSKVFKFTPSSSGSYKINTTYYGGTSSSGSNDTVLYLYSDANLTNQISYNDDSNGTTFSEINASLTGGTSYFIKIAGYNGGSVHARLAVTQNQTITFTTLYNKTPIDVSTNAGESAYFKFTPITSGLYRFFTSPYQGTGPSNDTYLYLYADASLTNLLAQNDGSGGPYGSLFL